MLLAARLGLRASDIANLKFRNLDWEQTTLSFHQIKTGRQLIVLKRQLGYKYIAGATILAQIDQLALQRNETAQGITKTFADQWQQKRPGDSAHYHYCRIRHLAQLSAYMCPCHDSVIVCYRTACRRGGSVKTSRC